MGAFEIWEVRVPGGTGRLFWLLRLTLHRCYPLPQPSRMGTVRPLWLDIPVACPLQRTNRGAIHGILAYRMDLRPQMPLMTDTDGPPPFSETFDRLDWIEQRWRAAGSSVWRGGPDGRCLRPDGSRDRYQTERRRGELAYWLRELRSPGRAAFRFRFEAWQSERRLELASALGVADLSAWASGIDVVEFGGGPLPFVALGRWRSAVSVDPLNEGYALSGILDERDSFVPLVCGAEHTPLASACCDLVVCDNTLDHVDEPAAVCCEISRLLRPGGALWLLVDVGAPADEMHPYPMHRELVEAMLGPVGMRLELSAARGRPSHPRASHQLRMLWRRTED